MLPALKSLVGGTLTQMGGLKIEDCDVGLEWIYFNSEIGNYKIFPSRQQRDNFFVAL